jgi:hypothetical protein
MRTFSFEDWDGNHMLIVLYSKISERESSLSGYELREMFETVK